MKDAIAFSGAIISRMTILDRILEAKLAQVAGLDPATFPPPPPRRHGLQAALGLHARSSGKLALIAEIKQRSPSRPLIRQDFDPPAMARAYVHGGAAALSILTDGPFFGGDPLHLRAAREVVEVPLLRKDFLIDPIQLQEALAYGADAALLIAAALPGDRLGEMLTYAHSLGLETLVEVHSEHEIDRALEAGSRLLGINNRDLATFKVDLATTERLMAYLASQDPPEDILLVSESGIASVADRERLARAGVRAMLVGEALLVQNDLTAAARALLA